MSGRQGDAYGSYYGGSGGQAPYNDPNRKGRQPPQGQQQAYEAEPYPTRRQQAPPPQQFMNYSGYDNQSFAPPPHHGHGEQQYQQHQQQYQHQQHQQYQQRQQQYTDYFHPSQSVHGQGEAYSSHQLPPDLAPNLGNLMHNPTTQIGIQALSTIGQDYMNKNLNQWVSFEMFRPYFDVDHSFVLRKLSLILFPFQNNNWNRLVRRPDGHQQQPSMVFKPPRDDLNAPDLYIPAMAVVTYVLLYGLVLGTKNEFHPGRLYYSSVKAITILLFELAMLKAGGFVLSISNEFALLDFLAILGYGFVGVILVLLCSLLFGSLGRTLGLLYACVSTFFFSIRSLKHTFLPDSTNTHVLNQRKRRIYFLFGVAAVQSVMTFILIL